MGVLKARVGGAWVPIGVGTSTGAWANLTLASTSWTVVVQPRWRMEGDRVWLDGAVERTTAQFAPGSTLFTPGASGNPPAPSGVQWLVGPALIRALTPDAFPIFWVATGTAFRTSGSERAIEIADQVGLSGISWPTT